MDYKNHIKIITLQDLLKAECFNVKASLQIIENALTKQNTKDLIFPNKVSVVFDESTQNRINCLPAGIRSQEVYGMMGVCISCQPSQIQHSKSFCCNCVVEFERWFSKSLHGR